MRSVEAEIASAARSVAPEEAPGRRKHEAVLLVAPPAAGALLIATMAFGWLETLHRH
jgi:hypothetical protein